MWVVLRASYGMCLWIREKETKEIVLWKPLKKVGYFLFIFAARLKQPRCPKRNSLLNPKHTVNPEPLNHKSYTNPLKPNSTLEFLNPNPLNLIKP